MTREEEIHKAAKEFAFSDKTETSDFYDVMNDFYYGAKWADETMIEKACSWLDRALDNFRIGTQRVDFVDKLKLIDSFKKAMAK